LEEAFRTRNKGQRFFFGLIIGEEGLILEFETASLEAS